MITSVGGVRNVLWTRKTILSVNASRSAHPSTMIHKIRFVPVTTEPSPLCVSFTAKDACARRRVALQIVSLHHSERSI